ncbi:hypothetical protein Cgig2_031355 [Carnegiea gigantea]|uniref:Reverse transcriptase n=1 Tax=Carnegiea gigantea TaxID=171969 RepID=A0A9Q1JQA8_9CARY|nr:hypothetical protein Cgig2_031355 [Carnegiea gigantea]
MEADDVEPVMSKYPIVSGDSGYPILLGANSVPIVTRAANVKISHRVKSHRFSHCAGSQQLPYCSRNRSVVVRELEHATQGKDDYRRTFKKAATSPAFKFHPYCKALNLCHLMFADDLLVFCKADPSSLELLIQAMHSFTQVSGPKANIAKSSILRERCLQITRFKEEKLPLTYLGVPITASKLIKLEYRTLIEKISAKIKAWSSRHLSYAGKTRLINSVLFSMFNYWASIFIFPQEVTQISRNFLWNRTADYQRTPHNAYNSKSRGGLGVKDFSAWNKACISKLVWAIAKKQDIMWVKWVHERYLKRKSWWYYTPLLTAVGTGKNCVQSKIT